jgi:SGNH hydrolase-like domain, acetyltransferase AlgX
MGITEPGQMQRSIPEERKWVLLEGLIKTLSTGRKLIVVALPAKDDVALNNRECDLRLEQIAQRIDVWFIDLQPALRRSDFLVRDSHWNVAGHKAVAAYLAKTLPLR